MSLCTLLARNSELLFDIELEDQPIISAVDNLRSVDKQLKKALRPSSFQQQQLLEAAIEACASDIGDGEVDLRRLAKFLWQEGYYTWLRTGYLSVSTGGGLKLRHSFLVCAHTDDNGQPVLWVVDPNFSEQFLVASPSDHYSRLCSYLPPVFVGTASQLVRVVELMCTELAVMFAVQGRPCPPWREQSAMITKWLPTRAIDECIAELDN